MGCLFELIVEILDAMLYLLTHKEERRAILDEAKAYFRKKLEQWKKK